VKYVLDASAILRYLDNASGAARVEQLLNEARTGGSDLTISAVNWGEVIYVLMRKLSRSDASAIAQKLRSLPLAIVPVSDCDAEQAAEFKTRYAVPYADAFAAALSANLKATLVTADFDLKSCAKIINVEFL
jgi:predicted nucleic acid-binding protein